MLTYEISNCVLVAENLRADTRAFVISFCMAVGAKSYAGKLGQRAVCAENEETGELGVKNRNQLKNRAYGH
jgi:hypothetical protein